MMQNKKVTIIGLGLIGGSLAKALRERLNISDITVVNRSIEPVNQAIKEGIVSRGYTEVNQYVYNSDIIFICTPVKYAINYILAIADKVKKDCIITDVGSTKLEIVEYINGMQNAPLFIGGHPMAGAEKTGYSAGLSHLFENAYYILTPTKSSNAEGLDFLTALVKGIGAIPVIMDAEEHDVVTGCISHVPHIVASALVNMVRQLDSPDGKMHLLAAGGFKDITRIASSSPEMWESIILSNKEPIKGILETYVELIESFKSFIEKEDTASVFKYFESARDYRNSFPASKKGLINPLFEIIVDVIDKPGIIGKIATILGDNGINIKNINVSNNREFEQGCLKISLPDSESANFAFDILTDRGYKVYKVN
ncbi:MAG: prephenate dehydrogenase [Clostridia bacterium]|nr:prephenate dehydrogenase [Clostridia bacterium]